MNVIIDTNLFISGIFWKGLPSQLLTAWVSNKFKLIVSQEIIEEYSRVLKEIGSEKGARLADEWLLFIAKHSTIVKNTFNLKICRDKHDNKFINCALSGKVDYLITGDKDLLELNGSLGLEIVTAKQFIDILKKK